jgi:hypothetical protein
MQAANLVKCRRLTRRGLLLLPLLLLSTSLPESRAAAPFDDPLFQRCVHWLLEGSGGALIDNLCTDQYGFPPPSLFICARKVTTGFQSAGDQEGCALLFEDQTRKIRAGYVK